MAPNPKRRWKPTAILLRARGRSMREIATMLPVSESTLYRWWKQDRDGGHPWPEGGVLRTALVAQVEELLDRLRSDARSVPLVALVAVSEMVGDYSPAGARHAEHAATNRPVEPLLTLDAVADALGRTVRTVRRLVADGTLPAVTTGTTWGNARPIRWVPLSAVIEYLWGADDDTSAGKRGRTDGS